MALMTPAEYFGQPLSHKMPSTSRPRQRARAVILPGGCRLYQFPAPAEERSSLNDRSNDSRVSEQANTQEGREVGEHSR